MKAAKLVVAKRVYRITSGKTIVFDGLDDFIFDGGGSTFLFRLIPGGHGVTIKNCQRSVFSNFNLDWDWKVDPPAWVGRVTALAPDQSFFEMHFDTTAPLDPKKWVSMNPLDEMSRAPGVGVEFGGFAPTRIERIDDQTVRVWPSYRMKLMVGRLYLLRHYTYEKHAITMGDNSHLSLRNVNIFSFPGIGFITGGDQHHFELIGCRIAPPAGEHRPITTSADGFHVAQSQGFIRLEQCEFSFMATTASTSTTLSTWACAARTITPWWRCRLCPGGVRSRLATPWRSATAIFRPRDSQPNLNRPRRTIRKARSRWSSAKSYPSTCRAMLFFSIIATARTT